MNQTDPALPFLSDIFDISQLKRGRANLIVAPSIIRVPTVFAFTWFSQHIAIGGAPPHSQAMLEISPRLMYNQHSV